MCKRELSVSAPFVVVADDTHAGRAIERMVRRIRRAEILRCDHEALEWIRKRESPRPAGFVIVFEIDREEPAFSVAEAALARWIGVPVLMVSGSSDWSLVDRAQVLGCEVARAARDPAARTDGVHAFARRALAAECQLPNLGLFIDSYARRAGLTPAETAVLRLLVAEGASNFAVACDLRITENTAKDHVKAIPRKTGEESREGVANAVLRMRFPM